MNELLSEIQDALQEETRRPYIVSYILKDQNNVLLALAYDPLDQDEILEISGHVGEHLFVSHVPDWDFSVDEYFLSAMEAEFEISYMPIEEHYNVWCAIDEFPEEIDHQEGLQKYLKYCQTHDITPVTIASLGLERVNIMNLYKESYDGYRIMMDYMVNKVAYVIGMNPKAEYPFAVWRTSYNRRRGYDIGHYFETVEDAFDDFKCRVRDEVDKQVYLKRKSLFKENRSYDAR